MPLGQPQRPVPAIGLASHPCPRCHCPLGSPRLCLRMWESGVALGHWLPGLSSTRAGLGGACSGGCWRPPLCGCLCRCSACTSLSHATLAVSWKLGCAQTHVVLSGRGLWGPRGRLGLGAVRLVECPLCLCRVRWPHELVSAPDGDFCACPPSSGCIWKRRRRVLFPADLAGGPALLCLPRVCFSSCPAFLWARGAPGPVQGSATGWGLGTAGTGG